MAEPKDTNGNTNERRIRVGTCPMAVDAYIAWSNVVNSTPEAKNLTIELKDGRILLAWQEFRMGKRDSDYFPARLVAKPRKTAVAPGTATACWLKSRRATSTSFRRACCG